MEHNERLEKLTSAKLIGWEGKAMEKTLKNNYFVKDWDCEQNGMWNEHTMQHK